MFLMNCSFQNISGPVISATESNLRINYCFFLYNLFDDNSEVQNIRTNLKSSFEINACVFISSEGVSLKLQNLGKIILFNTIFKGASNGRGIFIKNFKNLNVFNCSFSFFTEIEGSAMFISNNQKLQIKQNESNIIIEKCKFFMNQANFGGSIYFLNDCQSFIFECIFSRNIANKVAAAINFLVSKGYTNNIISCRFEHNYAFYNNPNVFSNKKLYCENNSYINNIDRLLQNNNISSFPLQFQLNLINSHLISPSNSIEFISGVESVSFTILDDFNQSFFTEKIITGILFTNNNDNSQDFRLQQTLSLPTLKGELFFPRLLIKTKPNSNFSMKIQSIVFDYQNLFSEKYEQIFEFYSRPCLIGEILTLSESCKLCEEHTYSIVDPMLPVNR